MLRDVYWRQYPIDLLSDDRMACVEAMLPDNQKHIPYMIYIAALKLCDDNGVFDFDDGVVLARLTRVNDVKLVKDIVNMMRQRKILYRLFDGSSLCGLVDWTYSDKKPRTIDERRKLVAERIQKEQARAGVDKDFTLPGEEKTAPTAAAPQVIPRPAPVPDFITKCKSCEAYNADINSCMDPTPGACQRHFKQEDQTAPAPQDFLCAKNDKNAENVVISEMDDKNAKNVVTLQDNTLQDNTVQDNKTDNTDSIDIHTNTHTIQQVPSSGRLNSPTLETCENIDAVGATDIQTDNTESAYINTDEEACGDEAISNLADQALREAGKDVEDTGQAGLVEYLNAFFVKNCYGFKKKQSANAINTLAGKVLELSDDVNPPGTVASVMCTEFKKMCEGQREAYWKGTPLLPAYMIKPRIMAEVIQNAGKILSTAKNSEKFIQAAQKAQEECEADKELVGDAIREEYVKYNIDPDDPQASKLLLMAKSREAEAARKAEDEEFEIF